MGKIKVEVRQLCPKCESIQHRTAVFETLEDFNKTKQAYPDNNSDYNGQYLRWRFSTRSCPTSC